MKVAITGASGFIGRHVLRVLSTRPDVEIVASSRSARSLDLEFTGIRQVALDLTTPSANDFEALGRPDVLIHLAWAGLPNYRSLHHFETELPRQYAFLGSLVKAGLRNLFVTGTCYEYGMTNGELVESLEAAPTNPYAHAKTALRRQLQFLRTAQPYGLTWARLFYMFGADQPGTSLYPQLAAAAARGDRAFAMSRGEQLRDFLPVEAVARAIVELSLNRPDSGVVNVCSGNPVSIRSLVEAWKAANGWDIELDLGRYPYPEHEPLAFWGSPRKLHALIGAGTGDHAS
jgi:nucleoside-diphosphate-sugar epimerase